MLSVINAQPLTHVRAQRARVRLAVAALLMAKSSAATTTVIGCVYSLLPLSPRDVCARC